MHYSAYVGKLIHRIDMVDEASASVNYRIQGVHKPPILLRIHRRVSSELALMTLQSIQRHIFESGAFSDSPLNSCLIPLPSSSGRTFEKLGGQFVEAYPFAEDVAHYSGESLAQIRSLAERYGRVQKALGELDPSADLGQLNSLHPYFSWFGMDKRLFEDISSLNRRASRRPHPDRFAVVFDQHHEFLTAIWREVKPSLAQVETLAEPLLHDFHPHNTFFRNDQCLLIYDYEATSRCWSEAEALAFAVHRFVREYVRLLRERGNPGAEKEIRGVVDAFLESYTIGGPAVPPGFLAEFGLQLRRTNLAKLLFIMAIYYKVTDDAAQRSEDVLYAELVKFVSYLKEAEYFSFHVS